MNIQLAISKRFRQALRALPVRRRDQVWEVIERFEENPTSSSQNYERLHMKDPKIRSIRVSDAYRIILADIGSTLYLLHVDHHDKAYRWAQNKKFEFNDFTKSYQLFTIDETALEPVSQKATIDDNKSPLADCTNQQLLKIGIQEVWLKKVRSLKQKEELLELIDHLPEEVIENLELLFDSYDIRNLIRDVEEGAENLDEKTGESLNQQRNFFLSTDDQKLKEVLLDDFELWRVFLHPSQRVMAYKPSKGPMKVTGGAGTGKTVVAIHRAKFLAAKLPPTQTPILFTTFTNSLVGSLSQLIYQQGAGKEKVDVRSFFSLIYREAFKVGVMVERNAIIKPEDQLEQMSEALASLAPDIDPSFVWDEWREVILPNLVATKAAYLRVSRRGRKAALGRLERKLVWVAIEAFKEWQLGAQRFTYEDLCYHICLKYDSDENLSKPFSHLICDELQDFDSVHLQLMRRLVPEGPNDLFLVGDPFQNIYSRKLSFQSVGINIRGSRSKKLKLNYRTTDEIRKKALQSILNTSFHDFDEEKAQAKGYVSLMHGDTPYYITCQSIDEQYEQALDFAKQAFGDGQVAFHECCIAAYSNARVKALSKKLSMKNIPHCLLQKGQQAQPGQISLATFHNMKGLEFKRVMLLDLGKDQYPYTPKAFNSWSEARKKDFLKASKALLYVAMSRAVNSLILAGVGEEYSF